MFEAVWDWLNYRYIHKWNNRGVLILTHIWPFILAKLKRKFSGKGSSFESVVLKQLDVCMLKKKKRTISWSILYIIYKYQLFLSVYICMHTFSSYAFNGYIKCEAIFCISKAYGFWVWTKQGLNNNLRLNSV